MMTLHWLKIILVTGILVYLCLCLALYTLQKKILFPTYATAPVTDNWQPSGQGSEQAFIDGSCGKLHVAIWRTPAPKGTIMMFHGNGESLASIDDYVSVFHQLGYNLMAWDYPGYGRSTDGWFSQEMLLQDAETAYQWLAHQVAAEDIHLFGYSLGTGLALSIAAKYQHNPVYLVAAYDSLHHIAKRRFGFLPVDLLFRYPMQTEQWVAKINQPIYLMHGRNDRIIKPSNAEALVAKSNGKAHIEWVENAGHANDALFAYRNQWLKQWLPK